MLARAAKPGAMREQSQIDEMRAALRGDLERAKKHPRPSPIVVPEERAEPEPPAEEQPRPSIFSSLFKRVD